MHRSLAKKSILPRFIFHLISNSHHPSLRGKDDGRRNTTVETNISRSERPTALQHCATTILLRNDNDKASDHHTALLITLPQQPNFVVTPPTLPLTQPAVPRTARMHLTNHQPFHDTNLTTTQLTPPLTIGVHSTQQAAIDQHSKLHLTPHTHVNATSTELGRDTGGHWDAVPRRPADSVSHTAHTAAHYTRCYFPGLLQGEIPQALGTQSPCGLWILYLTPVISSRVRPPRGPDCSPDNIGWDIPWGPEMYLPSACFPPERDLHVAQIAAPIISAGTYRGARRRKSPARCHMMGGTGGPRACSLRPRAAPALFPYHMCFAWMKFSCWSSLSRRFLTMYLPSMLSRRPYLGKRQ